MTTKGNTYRQPHVTSVAPDAIVFIEGKGGLSRTLKLEKYEDGQIHEEDIDIMNYVSSISVSKGIDRVPGEASITLRAPKHMMDGVYGSIRKTLSTMLEVEIYMKGRFLFDDKSSGNLEPRYYPVFWGVISNLSDNEVAGDLTTVTVTCQDMMRWLAVTKVNVKSSIANSHIETDVQGEVRSVKNNAHPYSSYYVGLSTPGIIADLVSLSTDENFFQPKNITEGRGITKDVVIADQPQSSFQQYTDQLIEIWRKKFDAIASALFIYGFDKVSPTRKNQLGTHDVDLDIDSLIYIYGARPVDVKLSDVESTAENVPWIDVTRLMSKGAAAFKTEDAPLFASNFQDRLSVANEAKDQVHLEFYQDVDGTIVLKPPFYNMETRENKIYTLEDIDIVNFNVVEDESVILTRIDVTGAVINGANEDDITHIYGYAIDFDKLLKFGLRDETIQTNFLTTPDDCAMYAQRELARRNTLIYNGSISIQGRPEIKLGYPVYVPSRDEFYYVTGITHSFTFGGSFDTQLTVTTRRGKKIDRKGNILKDLLVETDGTPSDQVSELGEDVEQDEDNPLRNQTKMCDAEAYLQFIARRPDFRFEELDEILKYQGTFRYIQNSKSATSEPRKYNQVTDSEGYDLTGNGYPFAKDLSLQEDFRIFDKNTGDDKSASLAASMTLSQDQPTLSYQQPLTLDQIQNPEAILSKSKSNIIESMAPTGVDQPSPKDNYNV